MIDIYADTKYAVAEKFVSINGEGRRAGEPAAFVRFKGCNLRCTYCDTLWASEQSCPAEYMSADEIVNYIRQTGIKNVTLTGGEPLLRGGMGVLIEKILKTPFNRVEIETNGSINLEPYTRLKYRPSFTMDYKLPQSGSEYAMNLENFALLGKDDTVKFVAGSGADLDRALEIIKTYDLVSRTAVYFSPVFGKIDPREIVEFMLENRLNDAKVQLQMHKFIWPPEKRGV